MSLNFSILIHRLGLVSLYAVSYYRAQWDNTNKFLGKLTDQSPCIVRRTDILMVMTSRHYKAILQNGFVMQTGVFR